MQSFYKKVIEEFLQTTRTIIVVWFHIRNDNINVTKYFLKNMLIIYIELYKHNILL